MPGGMGDMMGQMGWMMGGMMAYWALVGVLVLAILVLLAIWLFQQVRGGRRAA